MEHNDKHEIIASELTNCATMAVKYVQENTELSLLQLAAVFRIAATACDEGHQIYERAQMSSKIRGWKSPGT